MQAQVAHGMPGPGADLHLVGLAGPHGVRRAARAAVSRAGRGPEHGRRRRGTSTQRLQRPPSRRTRSFSAETRPPRQRRPDEVEALARPDHAGDGQPCAARPPHDSAPGSLGVGVGHGTGGLELDRLGDVRPLRQRGRDGPREEHDRARPSQLRGRADPPDAPRPRASVAHAPCHTATRPASRRLRLRGLLGTLVAVAVAEGADRVEGLVRDLLAAQQVAPGGRPRPA